MDNTQINIHKTTCINYLHYVRGYSVEEAIHLYEANRIYIDIVLSLIGAEEFIEYLLYSIGKTQQPKKKGNKKNGRNISN